MNERKLYLYQKIMDERQYNNDDQIDIFSLASRNQIQILMEDDTNYFIDDEDAYFVIYPDGKSCIVMKNKLSSQTKLEWISYLVLELLINKKFGVQESVEVLETGLFIKKYHIHPLSKKDSYFNILCELLVPSSKLSIHLYQTLNHNKVLKLAEQFFVREEIIVYKMNQFYLKARLLLDGISIKKNPFIVS